MLTKSPRSVTVVTVVSDPTTSSTAIAPSCNLEGITTTTITQTHTFILTDKSTGFQSRSTYTLPSRVTDLVSYNTSSPAQATPTTLCIPMTTVTHTIVHYDTITSTGKRPSESTGHSSSKHSASHRSSTRNVTTALSKHHSRRPSATSTTTTMCFDENSMTLAVCRTSPYPVLPQLQPNVSHGTNGASTPVKYPNIDGAWLMRVLFTLALFFAAVVWQASDLLCDSCSAFHSPRWFSVAEAPRADDFLYHSGPSPTIPSIDWLNNFFMYSRFRTRQKKPSAMRRSLPVCSEVRGGRSGLYFTWAVLLFVYWAFALPLKLLVNEFLSRWPKMTCAHYCIQCWVINLAALLSTFPIPSFATIWSDISKSEKNTYTTKGVP